MDLSRPVDAAFWRALNVEPHPVCPLPDEAWLRAHTEEQLIEYLLERDEVIHGMAEDPLTRGHEPAIWRILDALCDFPWMDTDEPAYWYTQGPAMTVRAWSLMVRRKLLHRDEPIKVLLLNGGNRGSKSEWAASRVMKILLWKAGRRAWCFHQDISMSRQYQQPLLYKYLPADLRTEKGTKKQTTYIAYKQQTGFSDEHFVLPNSSDCDFRTYEQNFRGIQGGELDVVWCDELVPATWIKELKARVATRKGWLLITFTPVEGYTATVKVFLDKAKTTVESWAFVLPKDGGEGRRDLALQGEDPYRWLSADTPANEIIMAGQPPVPAGREFDRVPRVMTIPPQKGEEDAREGVFFFHSFDNPFGNPAELFALYSGDTAEAKKMRFYGVATKMVAGRFPKFKAGVHTIPAAAVPETGTNYHVVDPCGGRNMAMIWARVTRTPNGKRYTIYREWPCPGKYVPGEGDLGNWAEPGDKHDGEMGPAQTSLGWGHDRYKQEILRLEGVRDWDAPVQSLEQQEAADQGDADLQPDPAPVVRRKPAEGEDVYERIMDSRYGNTPTSTRQGLTTLIEEFADIGIEFVPASGSQAIEDGTNWIHLINNLLNYEEKQPISSLNCPRLVVSEECVNTIFALQNWTGEDGLKGACKDFVDLVKYLVLHDCDDWSEDRRTGDKKKQERAAAAEAKREAAKRGQPAVVGAE